MLSTDRDAVICDFAETYHIYDFTKLPLTYAATLAVGFRDDSRIKTKLSGSRVSIEVMLQAAAVDALNLLVWSKTKDAAHRRNRPESLLKKLTGKDKTNDIMTFTSGAEFEKARQRILNNG